VIYVAYNGVGPRDPERAARFVTHDGSAFQVVRMERRRDAENVVAHLN